MKKLAILIASTAVVASIAGAYSYTHKAPSADEARIFSSKKLGVTFAYNGGRNPDYISVNANKITYKDPALTKEDSITIFQKSASSSIENAILETVANQGKNPDDCVVVNNGAYWGNPAYTAYQLGLKNKTITYTTEELAEIAQSDLEAKKDGGPFDGELKKQEIYNRRIVTSCSQYADPLGLGTSKSEPSMFVYNNKDTFVFLPGSYDPPFYQESSLVF